ncbi:hypothetical protein [Nonomuraea candida]|uniref:hypothetical protein n=1 Tax=Nonomuraea candida TaxID=359159 RepID=UPI0005BA9292|nr:hypothetical protein [Nonomuraea candida]
MKKARALVALTAAILAASACGQPEFTYVKDRAGTTYFKVPATFTRLDASPIELYLTGDHPDSQAALLRAQRVWSTAFDRSADPSVEHLLGSAEPFVYATVHQLTAEQRDSISLNRLRDFILPVTRDTRRAYLQQAVMTGRPPLLHDFEPISDEVLTLDDGARGVRVRFSYQIGRDTQTFDHTAVLDGRGATVSVLLIGCRSTCHRKRAAEFDQIASSFKLLRSPG